jgi:hypothetical protein
MASTFFQDYNPLTPIVSSWLNDVNTAAYDYALLFQTPQMHGGFPNTAQDSSAAIQAAVNALPNNGGTVYIGPGNWIVNTAPTWGSKSITWDIDPAANITGTQTTWPAMVTNAGVIPVGPWIVSRSATQATANNGTAAFGVEWIQPATLNGGGSGIYAGAQLNNGGNQSIGLAANFVATANAGSSGNVWALECDIGTFAGEGVGTQFGLSINGGGANTVTFAIKIQMASAAQYLYGLDMQSTVIGLFIENTTGHQNSIIAGSIPVRYAGNTVMLGQLSNSAANSALLLQRFTDASPVGYFINAVNEANTQQLFAVDVNGNMFAQFMSGQVLTLTNFAQAVATGSIQFGAQNSATASTGTGILPAGPVGFLIAYLGSNQIKIPYYNA